MGLGWDGGQELGGEEGAGGILKHEYEFVGPEWYWMN